MYSGLYLSSWMSARCGMLCSCAPVLEDAYNLSKTRIIPFFYIIVIFPFIWRVSLTSRILHSSMSSNSIHYRHKTGPEQSNVSELEFAGPHSLVTRTTPVPPLQALMYVYVALGNVITVRSSDRVRDAPVAGSEIATGALQTEI